MGRRLGPLLWVELTPTSPAPFQGLVPPPGHAQLPYLPHHILRPRFHQAMPACHRPYPLGHSSQGLAHLARPRPPKTLPGGLKIRLTPGPPHLSGLSGHTHSQIPPVWPCPHLGRSTHHITPISTRPHPCPTPCAQPNPGIAPLCLQPQQGRRGALQAEGPAGADDGRDDRRVP